MIPNKMEILRKAYSPRVTALLEQVGEELSTLEIQTDKPRLWRYVVKIPFVTTEVERVHVKWELENAGWGSMFDYVDGHSEDLMIYLPS